MTKRTILKRSTGLLKRLKRDETGITSITWALSLTVIFGAMGAAMDFTTLSNADSRSQAIADTTALAAAVYIKNNGRPPTEKGELIEGDHTAASLNYEYKSFVVNGAEGVNINISYDDDAKEVTTTVTGKTNPIFVQLLGDGYDELEFSAQSVVSYLDVQNAFPASIALILDNSGSMQFDDRLAINVHDVTHTTTCEQRERRRVRRNTRRGVRWVWRWVTVTTTCSETHKHGDPAPGAEIRLDGLKDSVIQFQTDLSDRLGTEDEHSRRTVRMGMLPYSTDTIANGTIPMKWGYLPVGTDGGNIGIKGMRAKGGTNSSPPMTTAITWLGAEDIIHNQEAERTGSEEKDPLKFVIFMTDGQNSVGNFQVVPGETGQWHRQRTNGNWETRDEFFNGSLEGSLTRAVDLDTIESCRTMKENGVKIFTIGYALENNGYYRVNGWNNKEDDEVRNVARRVRSAAYNLLGSCASSEDHFITAADADQLEAAFDEIQNAIVEELIRIKA